MKVSKQQLKQIIKEELEKVLSEESVIQERISEQSGQMLLQYLQNKDMKAIQKMSQGADALTVIQNAIRDLGKQGLKDLANQIRQAASAAGLDINKQSAQSFRQIINDPNQPKPAGSWSDMQGTARKQGIR